jgi:hypothetical protein
MVILAFGLLLGIPMALSRNKAARAPRYLLAAHLAAIIQGGLLLALTVAIEFSAISSGYETAAAVLLVAGMALFDLGLTTNWLQDVQDAFAEKSLGNKISAAGTPLVLVGAAIVLYGVVTAV